MKVNLINENFQNNYVANLLAARGVASVEDYYKPTAEYLQSPNDFKDIRLAAALYTRVVLNDKPPYSKILIVVDSDNDGYTSAAIIYQYTKRLNCHCKIDYWLHEGKQHGLQDHIDRLMEENCEYDLIILPDSSSNDAHYHDMLEEINTPCLILDHHLTDVKLSYNAVVVNNQLSPNYHNKELTGAGVV
jgi:single-stranded-DNA-specific exonuclease